MSKSVFIRLQLNKGYFFLPLQTFTVPKLRKIMHPAIFKVNRLSAKQNTVFLCTNLKKFPEGYFSAEEMKFIDEQRKELKKELVSFNRLSHGVFVQFIKEEKDEYARLEFCRKAGDSIAAAINDSKFSEIIIHDTGSLTAETLAFAEGVALGNYQFLKYKKDNGKINSLENIGIFSKKISEAQIKELSIIVDAVCRCRNFINEPFSTLNTAVFAGEIEKLAIQSGIKIDVMNKKKIETLKMGGLLAVNKASNEPPVFVVMEWNPDAPVNKKPYVFVGKGIVYDSGGMNLKPGDSMTNMKDDMSGAAAVASAIYAISLARLPVHVVGLIPVTDNKIGPEAIMPGDIIKMHNGMTVEVLNTDAEGRLILADALSYASRYEPELVIDLSTLTGAAVRAIGKFGIAGMQVKAATEMELLGQSGWQVYERIVEFPLWEEYGELMKSEIADLKNVGPAEAGAITAGKFLEKFTGYPYIHLDIAGPAFLEKRDSYRGQGGTGVGVRLLFDFIKRKIKK
jgi:leucyl aminopeptidase